MGRKKQSEVLGGYIKQRREHNLQKQGSIRKYKCVQNCECQNKVSKPMNDDDQIPVLKLPSPPVLRDPICQAQIPVKDLLTL